MSKRAFWTKQAIVLLVAQLVLMPGTQAHFGQSTATAPQAIKVPFQLTDVQCNMSSDHASILSEDTELELAITVVMMSYGDHKKTANFNDITVPVKCSIKFESVQQFTTGVLDFPDVERLNNLVIMPSQPWPLWQTHNECAKREDIEVRVILYESDLTTGQKVAIGVVGIVLSAGAGLAVAAEWGAVAAFLTAVGLGGSRLAGATFGGDDLIGKKQLWLKVDEATVFDFGGEFSVNISAIPEKDDANSGFCGVGETESRMMPPSDTKVGFLVQPDQGGYAAYRIPLNQMSTDQTYAVLKPPTDQVIETGFEGFSRALSAADLLQFEPTELSAFGAAEETAARLRAKQAILSIVELVASSNVVEAAAFEGSGQAIGFLERANALGVAQPQQALELYRAAITTAAMSRRLAKPNVSGISNPLYVIATPSEIAATHNANIPTLVTVLGVSPDASDAALTISGCDGCLQTAKRISDSSQSYELGFSTNGLEVGTHNLVIEASDGDRTDMATLNIRVLPEPDDSAIVQQPPIGTEPLAPSVVSLQDARLFVPPEAIAGGQIFGMVLDDAGAPVAKAPVQITSLRGIIDTQTDKDGKFVANVPSEGDSLQFAIAGSIGAIALRVVQSLGDDVGRTEPPDYVEAGSQVTRRGNYPEIEIQPVSASPQISSELLTGVGRVPVAIATTPDGQAVLTSYQVPQYLPAGQIETRLLNADSGTVERHEMVLFKVIEARVNDKSLRGGQRADFVFKFDFGAGESTTAYIAIETTDNIRYRKEGRPQRLKINRDGPTTFSGTVKAVRGMSGAFSITPSIAATREAFEQ